MSSCLAQIAAIHAWNSLDWLLAAIILLSTVRALLRGFLRALFGLAGLFCGYALAGFEYIAAADWVVRRGWIASVSLARPVCYVAILFAVMLVFGIAGTLVKRTADAIGLGIVDRLLGAVLGALRGVLLGVAIVMVMEAVAPHSSWLATSQLSSCFLAAAHAVSFVVPHTLR